MTAAEDDLAARARDVHEAVFSADPMRPGLLRALQTVHEQVNSTNPERPGLTMRMDRLEKLLDTSWKFIGAVGGLAVVYKVVDALLSFLAKP